MYGWRLAMVIRRTLIAGALLALTAPIAARASIFSRADPVVLHPHYRVVGHGGEATNGAYTILWSHRPGVIGTMVDERTGRRTRLRLPAFCRQPLDSQQYLG